jgi:hypothetical protein
VLCRHRQHSYCQYFTSEDNCHVHNLHIADDQVIIARAEDANYTGRKLEKEYEKCGLKTDYGKTEYLDTDHLEELQINRNTI